MCNPGVTNVKCEDPTPVSEVFKGSALIAHDPDSGIRQRAIVIYDIGLTTNLPLLAKYAEGLFPQLEGGLVVGFGGAVQAAAHPIDTTKMPFAPRILVYTNRVHGTKQQILDAFTIENLIVEIVDEAELFKSLFICYGSPDEKAAEIINRFLKGKGVKTWFFKDDALPGDKLHRVMHEGVNTHDRVLLICSRDSLGRNGVMNEIERVLEREAREGGADILIPITLDDFVYSDWAPERADMAAQVRSRVIAKIDVSWADSDAMDQQFEKLVRVLSKSR